MTKTACIIGLAICGAISCSSPTAPTPAPVLPTLTGQYVGTLSVQTCTESGAAAGGTFCPTIQNGSSMVYTPTQSGTALGGTMTLGGLQSVSVSGSVDTAGNVVLAGSGPINFGATLTITTWRGTLTGSALAGQTQFTVSTTDPIGSAVVTGEFRLTQ